MNRDQFVIRSQPAWLDGPRAIDVAIFKGSSMVTAMTFEEMENRQIVDPTLRGQEGYDFLQAVLDCAWNNGLRPTGFEHTAEIVAAKDRHLQDMRTIAFAKLNVEKPHG